MNPQRMRILKNTAKERRGPVVYWMSRDQRVQDNWALLHAQQLAIEWEQPLLVVFCLAANFLGATLRQYGFMLRGLAETFNALDRTNISSFLLRGTPQEILPAWLARQKAGLLVTDFDPLKIKREWKYSVLAAADIPCHEVDAHNIVPCWVASPKLEFAAYTLRPKLKKLLPGFLEEFPRIQRHPFTGPAVEQFPEVEALLESLQINRSIKEIDWLQPGSVAAKRLLDLFIEKKLMHYGTRSNDPTQDMQSNLSPYLHFGQLSPQRVAIDILRQNEKSPATEVFLEELIVRRELADNFCFYNALYDEAGGFPPWAQKSLAMHMDDVREYCYSQEEFEQFRTHDEIWNAAQRQLFTTGKMHGYMRMYWAKKILEWSENPRRAMETAIYLNDKYELDGRDPNGYAGIAWSIGGVHDRAWGERKVFGKIRFMNDKGLKRKFDINKYVKKTNGECHEALF